MRDGTTQTTARTHRRVVLAAATAVVLLGVAAAAGVLALRGGEPGGSEGAERIVRQADAGSTIQVEPGQRIDVRLNENPTTGYLWKASGETDGDVIDPVSDDWKVDSDCEDGMTGCGGVHTWRFEAGDEPGETEVAFDLHSRQPGEVVEEFAVTIEVG